MSKLTKQEALRKIAELKEYIEELQEEAKAEYFDDKRGWIKTEAWVVDQVKAGALLNDWEVFDALGSDEMEYTHHVYEGILFRVPKEQ